MEFNEKLQELRKQKGITQEQLSQALFVSRTAISKWESGRGYPSIDSLKAISKFFGITIDELLSCEELLTAAEEDTIKREKRFRDLVFGLLDCSISTFLFMPLFGQNTNGIIEEVSLLSLVRIAPYMKILYFVIVLLIILFGITTLALQNFHNSFWENSKIKISLILNTCGVILFTVSSQPYAATFLFIYLVIKVLMLVKGL